jgi:hypothetical protein
MRQDLIKDFEQRARQAHNTDEYDEVLAEAKALLSLAEYTALLGRLQQPVETGKAETTTPSSGE